MQAFLGTKQAKLVSTAVELEEQKERMRRGRFHLICEQVNAHAPVVMVDLLQPAADSCAAAASAHCAWCRAQRVFPRPTACLGGGRVKCRPADVAC